MQKIYVLDTNVLLCDPASILSFADRDVVIPMTVIEELDKKKNEAGELGYIFAAKNPDACVGDESRINKVKRIFFFTAPKKEGFFFV